MSVATTSDKLYIPEQSKTSESYPTTVWFVNVDTPHWLIQFGFHRSPMKLSDEALLPLAAQYNHNNGVSHNTTVLVPLWSGSVEQRSDIPRSQTRLLRDAESSLDHDATRRRTNSPSMLVI